MICGRNLRTHHGSGYEQMKIGIMTFWWSDDNYGQILQCYALQKYLRDAGHDAYLIRYDPRNDYIKTPLWRKIIKAFNPVKLYQFLLVKKRKAADRKEKNNNPRRFGEFRDKYIKQSEKIYYSYNELNENPPEADVYIAGSDQIWNPDFLSKAQIKANFLTFGGLKIKRMTYAASFGKETLDDDYIKEITPYIQKFNYISVREKSGLEICKQCGIVHARWFPDPTMLLAADVYRGLYKGESIDKPEKPYCFLYLLGNQDDFSIQSVYDWAEKRHLDVVYVTGNSRVDGYKKTYATIPGWLRLIDSAECVVTNSFHCSVFSLLFHKRFGVVPLTGNDTGMNGRFASLFEMFGIEERYMNADFSILDMVVDWRFISANLHDVRCSCKLTNIFKI